MACDVLSILALEHKELKHWGQGKMADILQTTHLKAFSEVHFFIIF